ncbi:transglutaminase family protein [Salipiger sp. P9]|uniref:transglutaminase family protein n=1 Tax=Salipiger pentaromativorans TaxID=2943193 RepID=UPI0021589DB1|nr:transglutaminase family protein [Salipiger pentaromativorans]MCR8546631.1 transglutaminase family protein [Salipiger pentaromativorans]
MRFSVRHETLYRYATPVTLAAHRLRLTPRGDGGRLLLRALVIEPEPAAIVEQEDAHGNVLTLVEFGGATDLLRIDSQFEMETQAPVPLAGGAVPLLPWALPDAALAPYLEQPDPGAAVRAFAQSMADVARGEAPVFLDKLTETLFARTDRRIRDTGYAQSPEDTLLRAVGACRDLAVLFIACCRLMGLPARFVSGYQARAESVDGKRHLHAWPEAFLPGIGWRGYDPTHGTRVSDGHVALCAAPGQAETMPVEGGYYGALTGSELSYRVEIVAEE